MNTSNVQVFPYYHIFQLIHEKKHEYKARLMEHGFTPADVSLLLAMQSFDPPLRRDRSPPPFEHELKPRGRHLFGITLKPTKLAALSQELRSVQTQLRDMYMTPKGMDEQADATFGEREAALAVRLKVVYDEVQEWRKKMRNVDPFGGVKVGGDKGGVEVDEEEVVNEKVCQEEGVEMEVEEASFGEEVPGGDGHVVAEE